MLTGVYADWFVGGVACILGLVILLAVWTGYARVYELAKVRWAQHQFGHTATKVMLYLLGLALIGLGIAICMGWKIHWEDKPLSRLFCHGVARLV